MINEISHHVSGVQSLQPKGNSEPVSRVQKQSVVDASGEPRSLVQSAVEQQTAVSALVDQGQIGEAVENLNQYAQSVQRQLEFTVDEESGKTIIKVIDAETGETIRDIPPEEVLNMQKKLKETSDQMFHRGASDVSLLFQGKA